MYLVFVFLIYCRFFLTTGQDPFIWPLPMEYSVSNELSVSVSNSFTMKQTNSNSTIITNAINRYMKLIFPHKPDNSAPPNTNPISILNINIADGGSNTKLQYGMDESYQLQFPNNANEGQLNSKTVWGALRGIETLSQIILYNYTAGYYQSYTVDINDAPRFKWRGMLVDTSRHFESVSTIKNVIDSLSYAKYNTLHWHIIDSPSFPYQCKIYDKLWNGAFNEYDRYSQNDVKEIIDYGYERGIRIVPEFDVPGHSHSWCAGYPEVCPIKSCNDQKKKNGKPSNGVLNPAANMTYNVISGLIAESTNLFIDDYIHLGGDEVNTTCWSVDPSIQNWMKQNNFNETDAEWYFDERVQNITYYDNGKQVINWVEVFNLFGAQLNGRQKFVTIQVWKAEATLLSVVAAGFNAILADNDCWYLNNVNIPWQKAYLNEPYKGINNVDQQKLILGGEGSVWGENVDASDMDNTMWPRGAAIAERYAFKSWVKMHAK
eukprot:391791_1